MLIVLNLHFKIIKMKYVTLWRTFISILDLLHTCSRNISCVFWELKHKWLLQYILLFWVEACHMRLQGQAHSSHLAVCNMSTIRPDARFTLLSSFKSILIESCNMQAMISVHVRRPCRIAKRTFLEYSVPSIFRTSA